MEDRLQQHRIVIACLVGGLIVSALLSLFTYVTRTVFLNPLVFPGLFLAWLAVVLVPAAATFGGWVIFAGNAVFYTIVFVPILSAEVRASGPLARMIFRTTKEQT